MNFKCLVFEPEIHKLSQIESLETSLLTSWNRFGRSGCRLRKLSLQLEVSWTLLKVRNEKP
jgi:hypothetical protein